MRSAQLHAPQAERGFGSKASWQRAAGAWYVEAGSRLQGGSRAGPVLCCCWCGACSTALPTITKTGRSWAHASVTRCGGTPDPPRQQLAQHHGLRLDAGGRPTPAAAVLSLAVMQEGTSQPATCHASRASGVAPDATTRAVCGCGVLCCAGADGAADPEPVTGRGRRLQPFKLHQLGRGPVHVGCDASFRRRCVCSSHHTG